MKIVWKYINENYQISNKGDVKSLSRIISGRYGCQKLLKEKILKPRIRGKGYLAITLMENGKPKHYYIHRLVAKAFLPNPNNYPQINHKDENKFNNSVWVNEDGSVDIEKSNLEWCTNDYNIHYGTRGQRSADNHKNKKCRKGTAVYQYSFDGNLIKEWKSFAEIYNELGIFRSSVSKCCRGVYKQSHGYIWSYNKLDEPKPIQ